MRRDILSFWRLSARSTLDVCLHGFKFGHHFIALVTNLVGKGILAAVAKSSVNLLAAPIFAHPPKSNMYNIVECRMAGVERVSICMGK
jgi:hypothetical protein